MKKEYIQIAQNLWFCITFYFTIVRYITQIKIFDLQLNNLPKSLGFKENRFWIILTWFMWFYQIYFWFHYFNII